MKIPANTTALAFIGDAVYELFVRNLILERGWTNADKMHIIAVRYVRAESQAKALKGILNELSDEEKDLVRRARNRKSTSKPKNADPVEYKLATAFEALVGYLYLSGENERAEKVCHLAVAVIDGAKEAEYE